MHELFAYEYCAECGGDECDHILCVGPFGAWFAMCKVGLLTDDVYFRNGELHEREDSHV